MKIMKNGINASKLKGLIYEKGFNYSTLAEETGINRNTISDVIEKGQRPSLTTMNALFYVLDMTEEQGGEIFFSENLRETKDKQEV